VNAPRSSRLVAVLSAAALLLAFALTPSASADSPACDPLPKDGTSFCVVLDQLSTSTTLAAAPFDLDLAFHNSSDNSQTDMSKWIDHIDFHLLATGGSRPTIVPSDDLPDQLVLAGDDAGSCTSPGFTDCDAGHGVFVVNISNAFVENGVHVGSFGVTRIVNVDDGQNPPPPGTFQYRIDLDVCAPSEILQNSCALHVTPSITVSGPIPVAGGPEGIDFTLPLWQEGDASVAGTNVHYAGTIDSGELHVKGTASKLAGGADAPDGPFQVFRLPPTCGTANGLATFVTHQVTQRFVTIEQLPVTLTGCPKASFTKDLSPPSSVVTFDGSASTVNVGGRTIHLWFWRFGDGHGDATTGPNEQHQYRLLVSSPRDYHVRLTVLDSAFALSKAVFHTVHGSATSMQRPTKTTHIHVSGDVLPARAAAAGEQVQLMLRRLRSDGRFHLVPGGAKSVGLDGSSHFSANYPLPSPGGQCKVVATYSGDDNYLPSGRVSPTFAC
jgi:PKD domain